MPENSCSHFLVVVPVHALSSEDRGSRGGRRLGLVAEVDLPPEPMPTRDPQPAALGSRAAVTCGPSRSRRLSKRRSHPPCRCSSALERNRAAGGDFHVAVDRPQPPGSRLRRPGPKRHPPSQLIAQKEVAFALRAVVDGVRVSRRVAVGRARREGTASKVWWSAPRVCRTPCWEPVAPSSSVNALARTLRELGSEGSNVPGVGEEDRVEAGFRGRGEGPRPPGRVGGRGAIVPPTFNVRSPDWNIALPWPSPRR